MAKPTLVVRPNDAMIYAGTALASAITRHLRSAPHARVAIPGGSALQALKNAKLDAATCARIKLTWVDERCVPFADSDSNRGTAHKTGSIDNSSAPLLDELGLFLDHETPQEARIRSENELRKRFDGGIDIALLGLGEDGHIASLFPGRFNRNDKSLTVLELQSPKPPSARISLTHDLLRSARTCLLVATGEGKRAAIERMLAGDERLPAVGLPNLTLITDLDNLRSAS